MKGWAINDVFSNKENTDHVFHTTLRARPYTPFMGKFMWFWEVKIYRILYKIAGVLCTLLTIIILWSQLTIFAQLSPFKNLVHLQIDDFIAQIIGIIPMSYMYACAFYALLQLNLFNYYEFMRNHQTDGPSLLFGAGYVSRMTVPLCYHFLTFAAVPKTAFESVMGSQDVAFIVGENFFIYFPIIVVVLTIFTYFDLYTKMLRLCNLPRFDFGSSTHNRDDGILETGRTLMQRERETYELQLGTGSGPAIPSFTQSPRRRHYDIEGQSDSARSSPATTSPRLTPQTTPSRPSVSNPTYSEPVRVGPTITRPERRLAEDDEMSLVDFARQKYKQGPGKAVARNKDKTKFEPLEEEEDFSKKHNNKK